MALACIPTILSIAASDPDGCAGIAADLRTFYALGVHGCIALTAATTQNTKTYSGAFAISPAAISSQIDAVFSDVDIRAVKVGLIVGEGNAKAVADSLRKWKAHFLHRKKGAPFRSGEKWAHNVVLDPVMSAQPKNKTIANNRTILAIRKYLLPLATFITPNQAEALALTGEKDAKKAAQALHKLGAKNVVIKGIKKGAKIADYAIINGKEKIFQKPFICTSTHGGGCIFSSAIAANLAKGLDAASALAAAEKFIHSSIANAWKPGKGIAAVEPLGNAEMRRTRADLAAALAAFEASPHTHLLIPEIGTNIVYALPNAKNEGDVAGVVGRVRRAGKSARALGLIEFGASSHVARMLLQFARQFHGIRAAINIANNDAILRTCKKLGMRMVMAERDAEPARIAGTEGESLQWLVRTCLRNQPSMPDAIAFTGSVGKEPSLVLFGRTPQEVVKKALMLAEEIR